PVFHSREVEYVFDETPQPARFTHDHFVVFLPPLWIRYATVTEHLSQLIDSGQGRTELMRDGGYEVRFHLRQRYLALQCAHGEVRTEREQRQHDGQHAHIQILLPSSIRDDGGWIFRPNLQPQRQRGVLKCVCRESRCGLWRALKRLTVGAGN